MTTELIKYEGEDAPAPTREQLSRLMDQVKAQLRAHPENYNQARFSGTECCIGGAMYYLATARAFGSGDAEVFYFSRWCLGESTRVPYPWLLMMPHNGEFNQWPNDLRDEFLAARGSQQRAEVGCKAIDRWMEERQ